MIKTPNELQSFEEQVEALAEEYHNPDIAIYPNPTSDCSWDCDYATICDIMQDKGDYTPVLEEFYTKEKPTV